MLLTTPPKVKISIHAPREGSDRYIFVPCRSTLYFNPRSPRGERPVRRRNSPIVLVISIHAPREGSDPTRAVPLRRYLAFQSTLPARGAT